MSDLPAVGGIAGPRRSTSVASGAAHAAADSDLELNDVRERIRAVGGSGWVPEAVVRDETRLEVLVAAADAARQAGCGVKLVTSRPNDQRPAAGEGEECWR